MKAESVVSFFVSLLNKEGFTPVLTDEEIQQAKQMEKYTAKMLAKKYFLKGFETAEITEKQPVTHEQTMRDAESFFELIYPMQDE